MKIRVEIEPHDRYIVVRYTGPGSPEISRAFMQQVVAACNEHQCRNVLAISFMKNPLGVINTYKLAEMFREVGFTHIHRMAYVDLNPDTQSDNEFAETVLLNRGLEARLFVDVEEGKSWLLGDV